VASVVAKKEEEKKRESHKQSLLKVHPSVRPPLAQEDTSTLASTQEHGFQN
jgi:hypothetical protein